MQVTVIYASKTEQVELPVAIEPNSNIDVAIRRSGILQRCPDIDLLSMRIGVFGKLAKLDDLLHAGDRIEIYRPLEIDPKTARLLRAERKRGS